jgi:hypothetical protein
MKKLLKNSTPDPKDDADPPCKTTKNTVKDESGEYNALFSVTNT